MRLKLLGLVGLFSVMALIAIACGGDSDSASSSAADEATGSRLDLVKERGKVICAS